MNELTVVLSSSDVVRDAKRVYERPGVCGIQGDPELIDAVAHGREYTGNAARVTVQVRPSVVEKTAASIRNVDGVVRVTGNSSLAGVMT